MWKLYSERVRTNFKNLDKCFLNLIIKMLLFCVEFFDFFSFMYTQLCTPEGLIVRVLRNWHKSFPKIKRKDSISTYFAFRNTIFPFYFWKRFFVIDPWDNGEFHPRGNTIWNKTEKFVYDPLFRLSYSTLHTKRKLKHQNCPEKLNQHFLSTKISIKKCIVVAS